MAILSSSSLIRGLSVFHITLAYFLLTSPQTISDQNVVLLLGEAMHLPQASSFDTPTSATAFLAILFAFLAVSDFTAVSMTQHLAMEYWSNQAPMRLLMLFALTGYTYLFKSTVTTSPYGKSTFHKAAPADSLKNGLVFTWAFMEMGVWFLVYLSLKEERRQMVVTRVDRREAQI